MMFQRILVPLDGSKNSERALPVALRLARSNEGTIILLHVVNTNWPSFAQTIYAQALPDKAKFEAEKYLTSLLKSDQFQGIRIKIIVPFGVEGAMILTTAKQQHADIIVISSHGYTGVSRWMVGSIADKVTRYAETPVLLLHGNSALPLGPHPDPAEPLRILVPLDGSIHAMTAIEPAAELVAALGGSSNKTLHLTHVIDDINQLQSSKYYLQRIATKLKQGEIAPIIAEKHLTVTWSVAVNTDTADAIIRLAEDGESMENSGVPGGCDIIAMSTHGLTGLSLWTLDSITERIRIGTPVPLLIIRPTTIDKSRENYHLYEPELHANEA
jgi:Universal stress protein UspA and related nucleotide-binding proteins